MHEEDKLVEDKDVGKFARILREELIRHNKAVKSLSDVSWAKATE